MHPTWEASYEIALAHFGAAVRGATFAGPSLMDGLENLALLQACETSAQLGSSVSITAE
jgi:predicted dehydrogenase